MAEDNLIVRCPHCGAKNRIPRSRAGQKAVCGKCRTPLPQSAAFPEQAVQASDYSFRSEVLDFRGPAAVMFWARWCGHCQRLLPVFDELAREFSGSVKFVKVELEQNPATASQYQVQSVPTIILFKNGGPADRVLGAVPKHQLEQHLRSIL